MLYICMAYYIYSYGLMARDVTHYSNIAEIDVIQSSEIDRNLYNILPICK